MNYTHTQAVGGQRPSLVGRLFGRLTLLLGFAALASAAVAQTGNITGRVLNQGTGEYLRYAQVQVVGSERTTLTQADGRFSLTNIPAGEVKLSVAYTGLDSAEVTVTVPAGGTVDQQINLTTGEYGDTIRLGEFRVASAREGNAKAIVEQKVALNLKTVVAADAFGDVSEGNVGEFLRLLPGVTVDYVDNDVRATRIRGLPPKYTGVTLDGHAVATASSSSIANGRLFELEQVSLTSLDIVESTKTPTPDQMGSNLAGNTNAISKSAFNQKGQSIKYQANVTFNQYQVGLEKSVGWDNEDRYKAMPGGQIEFVDTFFDGKLGVVASAAHSGSYAEQRILIGAQAWDNNPDNNQQELPEIGQWNYQHGLKPTWRESFLVNLDYKPTDELQLSLRTSYGYYRSEFYNRNWLANGAVGDANRERNPNDPDVGWTRFTAQRQTVTGRTYDVTNGYLGTVFTTTTAAASNSNNYFRVAGSNQRKSGGTFVVSPAATWKHNDLKIDASMSYSQSKNAYTSGQDGYFSLVQAEMRGVSWEYFKNDKDNLMINQLATQTDPSASNTASNMGSMLDLANYNSGGVVNNERRNSKDQFWTANLDAQIDFPEWAIPSTFKVGVDTRLNVRDITVFQARWTLSLTTGATSATQINLRDYTEPFRPRHTVTAIDGQFGKTPAPDKWRLYELFSSLGAWDPFASTAYGPFRAQAGNNLRNMLQNEFDIKETVSSAYAMATVKPMKNLSVIAGLRFEKTKTQGRAFDDRGIDETLNAIGVRYLAASSVAAGVTAAGQTQYVGTGVDQNGVLSTTNLPARLKANRDNSNRLDYIYFRYGSRTERTQEYDNILPSAQARYSVNRNLVLRAAYFKSMLRPDFQSVVGGVTAVESETTGAYAFNVRNTDLEPETADNFDVSVEYYFEPVGVVSAGAFYKSIKDIQVNQPSQNLSAASADVLEQIQASGISASDFSNSLNTFTTTINGPKTDIWGYELAYSQELTFLPGLLSGLGVTANFTHIEPEEERIWALVPNSGDGLSKNSANLILRYKLKKFSTQLTATWADKKIQALNGLNITPAGDIVPVIGANSNVTTYIAARWQYNLNLSYQFHRRATVFLNFNNLLDAEQFRYAEREAFTTRHGQYGASINAGVKGTF